MRRFLDRLQRARWANLVVVNLRILLGYAFIPSGLKKVLDEPFTDPANTGAFHEFLHAFHATGFFYQFVGSMQLTIAILLMTQTFAPLGALLAVPVFATIMVFCWSTEAIFTAVMVTLMFLGALGLALWDVDRWRGILVPVGRRGAVPRGMDERDRPVDLALWRGCGAAILALYFATCILSGGIYRPKGVELDNPAFYIFPLIALFPVVTFVIEQSRRLRDDAG